MITEIDTKDGSMACPFCGKEIIPSEEVADESGWSFDSGDVCEHTLFIATSEGGFEYRSSLFNIHMKLPDDQDPEPSLCNEDVSVDELTSQVSLPGAVKICNRDPLWQLYAGFAPSSAE
jgi:hypothetical protein